MVGACALKARHHPRPIRDSTLLQSERARSRRERTRHALSITLRHHAVELRRIATMTTYAGTVGWPNILQEIAQKPQSAGERDRGLLWVGTPLIEFGSWLASVNVFYY